MYMLLRRRSVFCETFEGALTHFLSFFSFFLLEKRKSEALSPIKHVTFYYCLPLRKSGTIAPSVLISPPPSPFPQNHTQ